MNPPRVRLYVKGCGMSEAELGRIPKVVRAHYPAKPGSAHTRRVEHTVTRVQNHPLRARYLPAPANSLCGPCEAYIRALRTLALACVYADAPCALPGPVEPVPARGSTPGSSD